ncbi:hypothetical protein N7507_005785 [Penicillium longicatenatum]|nr:hypothetical protein N7507_005785 [Penicillium longicatenatum]
MTQKWKAILTIAERGTYNSGSNAVNLFLNLIPLENSWATTIDDRIPGYPLWWMVMSSSSEIVDSDLLVSIQASDLLNITTTKSNDAFRLTTESFGDEASLGLGSFHMPACNTSVEYGNWSLGVAPFSKESESKYWNWTDYAAPSMSVSFDDQTASLTLAGTFEASAYGIGSSESDAATWGSNTMGDIHVVFQGVLDGYHSDVLDMNGTTPTWLRTVGFGNNSLNIDNDAVSAGYRWCRALDVWGIAVIFATMTIVVSDSMYHLGI